MNDERLRSTFDRLLLELARAPAVEPAERGHVPSRTIIDGSYRVVRRLGAGGMGVVYLTEDLDLGRAVAIKLTTGGTSVRQLERMWREARMMARLSHPNVVSVYEVGAFRGLLFIAMEYLDGGTVREWLAHKERRWSEIVDVFLGAGRGLAAAHAVGVIHRDFKPDNVLISADGWARVADFGLAQPLDDEGSVSEAEENATNDLLTRTGSIVGTPAYMAPEQWRGEPVDARADQFSFCAALFEALYGERPFAGAKVDALRDAICEGRVREPQRGREVPARLQRILRRGLSADREDRYPSIEELLEDLAARPWSRWWLVGGGVLLLATSAAVSAAMQREPLCEGGEDQLTRQWSAETRDEVRAALSGLGKAFAADAFERVDAPLAEYAAQWDAAFLTACEARHIRDELSPQLYDQQIACLDPRRKAFGDLVQRLRQPDEALALQAPVDVARLAPIEPCTNLEALRSLDALPEDPEARREVMRLTQALRDFDFEGNATVDDLRREIEELVAEAEATGYRPLIARAKLRLVTFYKYRDLPQADIAIARDAFLEAIRSGDDVLAATAAGRITLHYQTSDPTLAIAWAQTGLAFLERSPSPKMQMDLRRDLAFAYVAQARWDDARGFVQTTLDEMLADDPNNVWLGQTYHDLSVIESRAGDIEKARHYVELGFQAFVRTRGEHHPLTAVALMDLGRHAMAARDYADAETKLQRAHSILREAYGHEHAQAVWAEVALGELEIRRGNWERAHRRLAATVATYRDRTRYRPLEWLWAQYQLSKALYRLGEMDAARKLLRETIAETRTLSLPALLFELLGFEHELELAAGDLARAEQSARETIALAQKFPKSSGAVASAWMTVGEVSLERGELADARADFDKALDAIQEDEKAKRGWPLFGLARVDAASGDVSQARARAREALTLLDSLDHPDPDHTADRIREWLANH